MTDRWSHNVHYRPVILNAVPPACREALDIGCGSGGLACELADRSTAVAGIDLDARMIELARERSKRHENVAFIHADFLKYPFNPESFDFVSANTSLHHMDFEAALRKMAQILRPGGRLAVIGLARDEFPADWAIAAVAIPADCFYKTCHGYYTSAPGPTPPLRDPDMSWAQVRTTVREILPGVRYRRLLLWRYSLLWDKPACHEG